MKARVIATRWPRTIGKGDQAERIRHEYGEIIEVSKEDFKRGVELGALQAESDTPPPNDATNWKAAVEAGIATQPNGEPLTDLEGNPLGVQAGPDLSGQEEWKAPRTHKDADAQLRELGISAPEGATVAQKAEIIEQYRAAMATGETPAAVASEDISELDDGELIQRGVDFGLSEEELVEKSHDELVLIVAEAMARQSADPQVQQQRAEELAANREAGARAAAERRSDREG